MVQMVKHRIWVRLLTREKFPVSFAIFMML